MPTSPASFTYNSVGYQVAGAGAAPPPETGDNFEGYVKHIHRRFGVVAAAVYVRAALVSQIRFQWRNESTGLLFGNADLDIVERPDPGHLTRHRMLTQLEQHLSYAGNAYVWRRPIDGRVQLLNPGDVDLLYSPDSDLRPDEVPKWGTREAFIWYPQGRHNGRPRVLDLDQVAHIPGSDPAPGHRYLGESWVTGVLREIINDGQATDHITSFFQHAATPSIIIAPDAKITGDQRRDLQEAVEEKWSGSHNAGRPFVVGGGSDVTVVGSRIGDLALRDLQGGFETRVAARSRVPAVLLGIREGLGGSSLNAGNYTQVRRQWADLFGTPYFDGICSSLEWILPRPPVSELTFDPARVMFLQDDRTDEAQIFNTTMAGIRQGIDGGFVPDAVVNAAKTGRLDELLTQHTGLTSVQLVPPGQGEPGATPSTGDTPDE